MKTSTTPSTGELIEGISFFPIALVVASTIFPGFTLVIPGLLFVTVIVLLPIVAIALVLAVVAAVVAAPVFAVRAIRARLASTSESTSEVAAPTMIPVPR
jgi:membrane protein implicated in regulation of membrane protease activity